MAQSDEQKQQAALFAELEKNDVKVASDDATKMKENIMNANSGQPWLGVGVHNVFVQSVELIQAKTGTLGIKFVVENPDGRSEVSMWLSEKALPYTIENISRILVHNAADDKKGEVRNYMANITSAKEIFTVAKEKMVGAVAYLSVRESQTQTYTDKNGEVKPGLERSLLSYAPKEAAAKAPANQDMKPVNLADIPF